MPQSSTGNERPTSVLIEAGEIMRTVSLPRLTTLQYIESNETYTQQAVADVIGCSRSSVSQYLQSMTTLPVALVEKQGQHYRVTDAGKTVLCYIKQMLKRFGIDLEAVDWTDKQKTEEISACLSPFDNARSTAPFLLLYSIGTRSALGDRVELLGTPLPVTREDVIQDVIDRQKEYGESITRKRIQHLLRRFTEANTINYDDQELSLTEKGHEQANLLEQLIQLLEQQQEETDIDNRTKQRPMSSRLSTTESVAKRKTSTVAGQGGDPGGDSIAFQDDPRGFLDRGQLSAQEPTDTPAIVPVYCLCSTTEQDEASLMSGSPPIVPLESFTLNELADRVGQLIGEHDEDVELKPYWALETEAGYHPLAPARLPLEEASQRAWKMVNDAHERWHEHSQS